MRPHAFEAFPNTSSFGNANALPAVGIVNSGSGIASPADTPSFRLSIPAFCGNWCVGLVIIVVFLASLKSKQRHELAPRPAISLHIEASEVSKPAV